MRPRLREVAAKAQVSEATVSRVVNGRDGVATRTRLRVQQALTDLGYAPQGLPVPMSSGDDGAASMVGLILPELDNPVFPALAQSIERRLSARGLTTVLATATLEGTPESSHLAALRARGIEGFVVVSGEHSDTQADHADYHRLMAEGRAFVLVNGAAQGLEAAPVVSADDTAAALTGVRHLLDLGHRRIGLAGGPRRYVPMARKLAGYHQGLSEAGVDDEFVEEQAFTLQGGHLAALRLIERGVTAILAASDVMALGAIRAARELGLDVPRDLSVIGYDDAGFVAHTAPPLTTLRQPVAEMGAAAADALADRLSGEADGGGELMFTPELVVRRSTAPVPD